MPINLGSRIQRIVAVSPDLPLTEGQQMYLAGRIAYEMNELIGEVKEPLSAEILEHVRFQHVMVDMIQIKDEFFAETTKHVEILSAIRKGRSDCLQEILDLKKPLLPHELKLIAQFLDMASDEFGRHGCNDFELPDTTRMRNMLIAMEKWNDPTVTDESEEVQEIVKCKKCFTMDWYVMSYMAHRVREALPEEED